jgi:gentisate 1,2-dioxygenase
MARASRHNPVTRLEYRTPVTGGPALATLACLLEGMPAGTQTRPARETAISVIVVAREPEHSPAAAALSNCRLMT